MPSIVADPPAAACDEPVTETVAPPPACTVLDSAWLCVPETVPETIAPCEAETVPPDETSVVCVRETVPPWLIVSELPLTSAVEDVAVWLDVCSDDSTSASSSEACLILASDEACRLAPTEEIFPPKDEEVPELLIVFTPVDEETPEVLSSDFSWSSVFVWPFR